MSLLTDMTNQSRNPHVRSVVSEQERIVRNWRAAPTDIIRINEAEFVVQFARACRVNDFYPNELNVLHEQAVNRYTEA